MAVQFPTQLTGQGLLLVQAVTSLVSRCAAEQLLPPYAASTEMLKIWGRMPVPPPQLPLHGPFVSHTPTQSTGGQGTVLVQLISYLQQQRPRQ